jgi:predicted  nucleic acid-binding Zn-ribbon protein
MDYQKTTSVSTNVDEEIRRYIQKKKDENSALKKLLSALEAAKKNGADKNITN